VSKLLTRAELLGLQDLAFEDVELRNGTVRVFELTGGDWSQYQSSLVRASANGEQEVDVSNAGIKLAILSLKHPDTKELQFTFDDAGIAALGMMPRSDLDRIVEAANRLSRITPKDVEELVGDLKETPASDSATPSP
jgi:hypothetical protein